MYPLILKVCELSIAVLKSRYNEFEHKTSRYNYRATYMNSMETTSQKPTNDTQKAWEEKGTQAYH